MPWKVVCIAAASYQAGAAAPGGIRRAACASGSRRGRRRSPPRRAPRPGRRERRAGPGRSGRSISCSIVSRLPGRSRNHSGPPEQPSHTAPPADRRVADQRARGAARRARRQVRQVAGEQEQLQLEADRQRVGRRVARLRHRAVEQLQEPHQAVEDARLRVGLGVQLQHRLGPDQGDAQRVGPLPHRGVRRGDVGAGDGVQLAAALVQHERRPGQRLQPPPEPRRRLAHALRDGVHPAPLGRVDVQHPVGLAKPDRAQHDRVGSVGSPHGSQCRRGGRSIGTRAYAPSGAQPRSPRADVSAAGLASGSTANWRTRARANWRVPPAAGRGQSAPRRRTLQRLANWRTLRAPIALAPAPDPR